MSSTNVHSKRENRYYHINCGQTIANNEGKIEIPPRTAKKGPSTLDIEQGLGMSIVVEAGELRKDGKLISQGKVQATFPPEAYKELANKQARNKAKSVDKGTDR